MADQENPEFEDDLQYEDTLGKARIFFFMSYFGMALPYLLIFLRNDNYDPSQVHVIIWLFGTIFYKLGGLVICCHMQRHRSETLKRAMNFCTIFDILWSLFGFACFVEACVYYNSASQNAPIWILVFILFLLDSTYNVCYLSCCCDHESARKKRMREARERKEPVVVQRIQPELTTEEIIARDLETLRNIEQYQVPQLGNEDRDLEKAIELSKKDMPTNAIKSHLFYDECVICKEKFKSQDTVKDLPCRHIFHAVCIDQWLLTHKLCPVCKINV